MFENGYENHSTKHLQVRKIELRCLVADTKLKLDILTAQANNLIERQRTVNKLLIHYEKELAWATHELSKRDGSSKTNKT